MYLKKHNNIGKLDLFDTGAVTILNLIISETNSEIVISSDWKYWVTFEEMCDFYTNQGIKKPIGYTPSSPGKDYAKERSLEILEWLEKHSEVTKWVSIDDLDMRNYLQNFVWIENIHEGIKDVGIKDQVLTYLF
jgi:hypothetical protein